MNGGGDRKQFDPVKFLAGVIIVVLAAVLMLYLR